MSKFDLESEIKNSERMSAKIRESDKYAQNLYAALCNNEFLKQDVISILKDDRWSCSWRYAGGIISDIRDSGSYIDWYCSGITSSDENSSFQYLGSNGFVSEGAVTQEIFEDLLELGWTVIEEDLT